MPIMPLPARETGILWRYFDGVSTALAARLTDGFSAKEDHLTFLLMELMDEGRTARHVLEYPLSKAKADLADGDGAVTLDMRFETSPHSSAVESRYSGADLGIVFVREHPLLGRQERGVLLQAKRLFPSRKDGVFDFGAEYRHFDPKQYKLLELLRQRFSAYRAVFYLWYNPSLAAFDDDAGKLIRSLEALGMESWTWYGGRHPMIDDLIEMGWPMGWGPSGNGPRLLSPADDEAERAWRRQQPATRVSSTDILEDDVKGGQKPRLSELYRRRSENRQRRRHRNWSFEPFADLMVRGLVTEGVGHDESEWLRLVRGEKVQWPAAAKGAAADEGPVPNEPPGPRASITFTLRSTVRGLG